MEDDKNSITSDPTENPRNADAGSAGRPRKLSREDLNPNPPEKALVVKDARGQLVLADDAAISPDSLPVLNAFRQFLEIERRRNRNRIIVLSSFFAALLIVILVAAFFAARTFWGRVKTDLAATQRKVEVTRLMTQANLSAAAVKTDAFRHELQRDLARQKQVIDMTQTQLHVRIADNAEEVDALKETVTTLEMQNAAMSYSLQGMQSNWQALAGPRAPQAQPAPASLTPAASVSPQTEYAPPAAPPPTALESERTTNSVSVMITPSNQHHAISLRLPPLSE